MNSGKQIDSCKCRNAYLDHYTWKTRDPATDKKEKKKQPTETSMIHLNPLTNILLPQFFL